jgi:transcriptional regulator GlxA family with amidase domain
MPRTTTATRTRKEVAEKVGTVSLQPSAPAGNHQFMPPRRVLIVLFDDIQSLDVSGPLEVFDGANRYLAPGDAAYAITTASHDGQTVRTSSGLTLTPDTDLNTAPAAHTLVVPGGRGTRDPDPGVIDWLRHHAPNTPRTISVCTGAFLLAAAGLLRGRRVTTHWSACATLAERFPDVQVDPEPIFIRDGDLATSAGVTTGIDLALALVEEDLGRDAALTIARHLVMFLRRPGNQTQFSAQLAAQWAERPRLRETQRWIAEHPGADLSVPTLAQRAHLSPRQFARAFTAEVGTPPGHYVDLVRMEAARRQLEDTDHSIEHVARTCGYGTPESMRRAFLRALGIGPAEYRRRF